MLNIGWKVNRKFNTDIMWNFMQLLVENSFTGFYFVKLNWATACIFILIKSVNDNKTVGNKIDGASGIHVLQYS